jgi:hypothetical protein
MATIEQMSNKVRLFEGMTLAQIKKLVQNSRVSTDLATAHACEVERVSLGGMSREVKIAVFLSGLIANLIDGD